MDAILSDSKSLTPVVGEALVAKHGIKYSKLLSLVYKEARILEAGIPAVFIYWTCHALILRGNTGAVRFAHNRMCLFGTRGSHRGNKLITS